MAQRFAPTCRVMKDKSVDGSVVIQCEPIDEENDIQFRCPRKVEILMRPKRSPVILDDGGCSERTQKKLMRHVKDYSS